MKQSGQSLDRIEQKATDYHQRVRDGFIQIGQKFTQRICKIDGTHSIELIAKQISDDFAQFALEHRGSV